MKNIDITKPVETKRHKFKVTDLHRFSEPLTNGATMSGVVNTGHRRFVAHWNDYGHTYHESASDYDIQNVPEETVLWANAYPDWVSGQVEETRTEAARSAGKCRIGYFKYTFTEGQDPKAEFVPLEKVG